MTASATQKIYVVTNTREKTRRLVRAPSKPSAQRFVTTDAFTTRVASQDDLAELLSRGVLVENARIAEAATE